MDLKCESCRFWHHLPTSEDGERGECRRYAPRPGSSPADDNYVSWAETFNSDWCGEWAETHSAYLKRIQEQNATNLRRAREGAFI